MSQLFTFLSRFPKVGLQCVARMKCNGIRGALGYAYRSPDSTRKGQAVVVRGKPQQPRTASLHPGYKPSRFWFRLVRLREIQIKSVRIELVEMLPI